MWFEDKKLRIAQKKKETQNWSILLYKLPLVINSTHMFQYHSQPDIKQCCEKIKKKKTSTENISKQLNKDNKCLTTDKCSIAYNRLLFSSVVRFFFVFLFCFFFFIFFSFYSFSAYPCNPSNKNWLTCSKNKCFMLL